MAADKRLETLQEEIKLLKGEVKHSLASVRDYLLNQELPSAELSGLYGEGEQKITVKSNRDAADAAAAREIGADIMSDLPITSEEEAEMPPEDEELINVEQPVQEQEEEELITEESPVGHNGAKQPPADSLFTEEEEDSPPDQLFEHPAGQPEEELREEEAPMDYARTTADAGPSTPRVNMLANLITWVARAKKDIGYEQLPVFLEVYGLSGHLSPELKEIILHFAEITPERIDVPTSAEVWSQAMLSLHGILTGGDAPLHPAIPSWTRPAAEEPADVEDEMIEVDRPPAVPLKLKLVFPDGNGKSKEYCLDLTPEADDGQPPQHRKR